MPDSKHIDILGGGPAGLAVAFYAHKNQQQFRVFEASDTFGGNAQTYTSGEFMYDSGAHRFHDKIPEVTQDLEKLMGNKLHRVSAPSQIFFGGKFINFPLTPGDLFKKLGIGNFTKASLSVMKAKVGKKSAITSFKDKVLNTYGQDVANKFLIPYSEKLWGLPADQLSTDISGGRLGGLNLKTFFLDSIIGNKSKKHLDGSFLYPEMGIGQIWDMVVSSCGAEHFRTNSPVTGLDHEDGKITGFTTKESEKHLCNEVISSLPVNRLVQMLNPLPPQEIIELSQSLKFRNVVLVMIKVERPSITNNATLYFPQENFMFTRVVEPKNRSDKMAPDMATSLVAEIPCSPEGDTWNLLDEELINQVKLQILSTGLIGIDEIIGVECKRMKYAYPVLDKEYKERSAKVFDYLDQFSNLHLTGRNGLFEYSHIHNLMLDAKELIKKV